MWIEHETTNVYASTKLDDDDVEMNISKQLAVDLLAFIETQLSVMRTLKIHHMSSLTKPMEELQEALTKMVPVEVSDGH